MPVCICGVLCYSAFKVIQGPTVPRNDCTSPLWAFHRTGRGRKSLKLPSAPPLAASHLYLCIGEGNQCDPTSPSFPFVTFSIFCSQGRPINPQRKIHSKGDFDEIWPGPQPLSSVDKPHTIVVVMSVLFLQAKKWRKNPHRIYWMIQGTQQQAHTMTHEFKNDVSAICW